MFNINHFLADEVMKWETDEETGRWIIGDLLWSKSSWNPSYDISDAMKVLDTFNDYVIRKQSNGILYIVWLIHNGEQYMEHGRTIPEAICNTILKAYGREERV